MAWVMVPVPEELTSEIEALLFRKSLHPQMPPWDPDLMERHLLSLEDEPRAALSAVAASVLAGDPIEDVELATKLDVSVREVFGLVQEANDVTVGASPGYLMHARQEEVELSEGGMRRRRVLYMLEGLASMVRDGENALGPRSRSSGKS